MNECTNVRETEINRLKQETNNRKPITYYSRLVISKHAVCAAYTTKTIFTFNRISMAVPLKEFHRINYCYYYYSFFIILVSLYLHHTHTYSELVLVPYILHVYKFIGMLLLKSSWAMLLFVFWTMFVFASYFYLFKSFCMVI